MLEIGCIYGKIILHRFVRNQSIRFLCSGRSSGTIIQLDHLTEKYVGNSKSLNDDNSRNQAYSNSSVSSDAVQLLVRNPHSDRKTWNLVISRYNRNFRYKDSISTFCRMWMFGVEPSQFTYGSILSACSSSQDIEFAEQLWSLVLKNGYISDEYVFTGFLDLFVKNGCFSMAVKLFSDIPNAGNVVTWNAIISGSVRNGENWVGLDFYQQMVRNYCRPNAFTFSSILTACSMIGNLDMGKEIHGWIVKCGVEDDIFVGTGIIDLYAKCGDAEEALKGFLLMPVRNVVSWTTIISCFAHKQEHVQALKLFIEMINTDVEINIYTITSVLTACANPQFFRQALQIHCWILKTGFQNQSSVGNSLINTHAKIGNMEMLDRVFEDMGDLVDVSSWAALLNGLAQNKKTRKCFELFQKMFHEGPRPDEFCATSVLSITNCLDLGRQMHSYLHKTSFVNIIFVSCTLLTMYSKCGNIANSYSIFREMPEKDIITWTSMIAGFAEHGFTEEAFQVFADMRLNAPKPDETTLSSILVACSYEKFLRNGKEIHGHVFRIGLSFDVLLSGALVTMYSRCKSLDYAVKVFEMMHQKDYISWSSIISMYVQNGFNQKALLEFKKILVMSFKIDDIMMSSALGACAALTSLPYGLQLHALIIKAGLYHWLQVSSALITMYGRCGNIDDSRKAFDQTKEHDCVNWTAMIDSYARNGIGEEALNLYKQMINCQVEPDSVTFTSVLSACSRSGLVDEGLFYFNSMSQVYDIEPEVFHYSCIVDLLCRSERLKEAANFIEKIPIEPNALMWTTLLSACRLHGELELGRKAAQKLLALDFSDSGTLISLSNLSAEMGDWEEVFEIREVMARAGRKRQAGWSSI